MIGISNSRQKSSLFSLLSRLATLMLQVQPFSSSSDSKLCTFHINNQTRDLHHAHSLMSMQLSAFTIGKHELRIQASYFAIINPVMFCRKKYLCQIIFAPAKLDENNFTSHVWWALIEEIARWLVKRRRLVLFKATCTTYRRIYGQQQLRKCLCVAGSQTKWKNFRCKIYSRKICSYVFFVQKYFCNEM